MNETWFDVRGEFDEKWQELGFGVNETDFACAVGELTHQKQSMQNQITFVVKCVLCKRTSRNGLD